MAAATAEQPGKGAWELSVYEAQRQPHCAVDDDTEIGVSPRSLHSELMCPICLDLLKKTMTTKECLHRFCSDCIITALSKGNKECPTCRKKLISKRSLRPDPNFDMLINKIYPSRVDYEAHQEEVLARLNNSHSQAALVNSITEGIKLQSQNRPQRNRKKDISSSPAELMSAANSANASIASGSAATATGSSSNQNDSLQNGKDQTNNGTSAQPAPSPSPAPSAATSRNSTTPSPVPSISTRFSKRLKSSHTSENETSSADIESMDTESDTSNEPLTENEIELIFKPHPNEMTGENPLIKALKDETIRYLKTTANASVEHLSKYLVMRLFLDIPEDLTIEIGNYNFHIYVEVTPGSYLQLTGLQTLRQINEKFWRMDRPLELYYACKKP
ncbi:E3 ubiquitin-protein ligase RING1-like [Trichogramma pretiosum]|uniref:RING-type E3 ubiquitin transferase n=1 Tax=Trichogramma kaykai TaxID=54128 RepID=A0ABD2W896_9HYME|nr:E3 ubiquitin-protein ligase RING1-like [Trichogramma pretiosum]